MLHRESSADKEMCLSDHSRDWWRQGLRQEGSPCRIGNLLPIRRCVSVTIVATSCNIGRA
jgi:hypothetical protein